MTTSPVEAFVAAVKVEIPDLDVSREHDLVVAAKKVRLAVESGRELSSAEWEAFFADPRVRTIARWSLTRVSVVDIDFDKTMHAHVVAPRAADSPADTAPITLEAVQRQWHALLTSVPDDGLPLDGCMVSSLELGRLVLKVSQGRDRVNVAQLPTAAGFRDRFLSAARAAGRLDLIDGDTK